MANHEWIFLAYKIPREPTSGRVYVWRKMKQLGALALQDAVWVLPSNARTQEQFQWLAVEIGELGGEVKLWTGSMVFESGSEPLAEQFQRQTDEEYHEILAEL